MAADYLLYDLLKKAVIVLKNNTRHMMNWLQVEQFVHQSGRDLIIFLAHHSQSRKNDGKLIIYCNFVKIQDKEHSATGPSLLYYYKRIPVIILANVCILLKIVNGATTIAYGVISHPNGMLTHIEVELVIYFSSSI